MSNESKHYWNVQKKENRGKCLRCRELPGKEREGRRKRRTIEKLQENNDILNGTVYYSSHIIYPPLQLQITNQLKQKRDAP